jgi:hypothetical protein
MKKIILFQANHQERTQVRQNKTLKYRGKIIGNYRGNRYAYTYKNFEFKSGREKTCSYSSCFSESYYDSLDDIFGASPNKLLGEEIFHTLITNFLYYKSSLGDLFIDAGYPNPSGTKKFNPIWIEYLEKLNKYAELRFAEGGLTKNEHYFRNELQKGQFPDNLDDFVDLNDSLIDDQKWYVYEVGAALYHMNDFDRSQGGVISESEKVYITLK